MKYAFISPCYLEKTNINYGEYKPSHFDGVMVQLWKADTFRLQEVIKERPIDKLKDYDIIFMIDYAIWAPDLIEWFKENIKAKIILLHDGDVGVIMGHKRLEHWIRWFNDCDGIFTFCDIKANYFKYITKKPVIAINTPQAVELCKIRKERNNKVFIVNGINDTRRNNFTNVLVAANLGMDIDIGKRNVVDYDEEIRILNWIQDRYKIKINMLEPIGHYYEFLERSSHYSLALNMDARPIGGRFTGDMAISGVHCVGSEMLDQQKLLYPELSVCAYDIGGAIEKCKIALADKDFNLVKKAQEIKKIFSSKEEVFKKMKLMEQEVMK